MKKALLFTFAILFAVAAMAQNRAILLEESFNSTSMPAGWSVAGMGTSNWSVSSTQNAGGLANELKLHWDPQFNGTSRMVTTAVDLTGINSVYFSFKHALDNYQSSSTLGIATTSDGGSNWNVGWSQNYNSNGVWEVTQQITTADMDKPNVQFCIFFTGNAYNINDWYFDDIKVFTLEELDLGLTASNIPDYLGSGSFTPSVTVTNYGVTTATTVELTYNVDGMVPVAESFDVNIPSLGNATLNFSTPITFTPGSYVVNFSIDKVNGQIDNSADNNSLSKAVTVALTSATRIPMIEHFSSSTCGPCVSVNNQMNNFCNNNAGAFTYTKYQMNWPGSGDPYYTEEGGTRRNFYGVSAVPQCFLDGEDQGYAAVQQSVFNQHTNYTAFMDIRGSFTVEGNTIHVIADVMPFIDANVRVFVSVNEKETHGNVGSNGETTFHHIFMKMLPNAQGTSVNFVSTELQRLEFTQDMSSTHVEEMSDLEVSIWVQNYNSHEILNSHFAYEYTDVHPYPVESLTLTEDASGNLLAAWNAPTSGTPLGYDVYFNGELAASSITNTEYTFSGDPTQFNLVEVVALYPNEMTSVKAAASTSAAAQDMGLVIQGAHEVMLDMQNPTAELVVANANYTSMAPIEILSVTEAANPNGVSYLTINSELPYSLEVNETYSIQIEPNNPDAFGKSVVQTYVTVESSAGSVEFFVEIDEELLSVTELTSDAKIYPNPTSGNFVVEGVNVAKVEIYNLVGQKVYEHQGKAVSIDASNWNKGLYLVNILDQNGSVDTRKLLVK